VRRGTEPALGEWSIPGGLLEVGETLAEGVVRELREETGLTVRVLELIEVLDRIFWDSLEHGSEAEKGPKYHFVIVDFLCEVLAGTPTANEEISELAFVREDELDRYELNSATLRVLQKGFALSRNAGAERRYFI
jgi:8-oxo-dGTP diphosphatase